MIILNNESLAWDPLKIWLRAGTSHSGSCSPRCHHMIWGAPKKLLTEVDNYTNHFLRSRKKGKTHSTSISVKTPSQTFEIAINVFAGAENDKLPLKAEIYLRTSQKSLISIWIFSKKKYVYGDSETMSVRSAIPAWLIDDVGHHFNTIS